MRQCIDCGVEKELDQFRSPDKRYPNYREKSCKRCSNRKHYLNALRRTKQRKLDAVNRFGGKCNVCGYNRCIQALEFDHISGRKTAFKLGLSSMFEKNSIKDIEEELKKCQLYVQIAIGKKHLVLLLLATELTKHSLMC